LANAAAISKAFTGNMRIQVDLPNYHDNTPSLSRHLLYEVTQLTNGVLHCDSGAYVSPHVCS